MLELDLDFSSKETVDRRFRRPLQMRDPIRPIIPKAKASCLVKVVEYAVADILILVSAASAGVVGVLRAFTPLQHVIAGGQRQRVHSGLTECEPPLHIVAIHMVVFGINGCQAISCRRSKVGTLFVQTADIFRVQEWAARQRNLSIRAVEFFLPACILITRLQWCLGR